MAMTDDNVAMKGTKWSVETNSFWNEHRVVSEDGLLVGLEFDCVIDAQAEADRLNARERMADLSLELVAVLREMSRWVTPVGQRRADDLAERIQELLTKAKASEGTVRT